METLFTFVNNNFQFILIILVIIWILNYLINHPNKKNNYYSNNWNLSTYSSSSTHHHHFKPNLLLPILIDKFSHPTLFNSNSGGLAVWTKDDLKGTPFSRIEIHDEMIKHNKPIPHFDCLYTWQNLYIPEKLVPGLHNISKGISYDHSAKTVRVRCQSLASNVVTHWIIQKYASNKLNLDEAVGKYGPMFMELLNDDPYENKYQQLYSEIH